MFPHEVTHVMFGHTETIIKWVTAESLSLKGSVFFCLFVCCFFLFVCLLLFFFVFFFVLFCFLFFSLVYLQKVVRGRCPCGCPRLDDFQTPFSETLPISYLPW